MKPTYEELEQKCALQQSKLTAIDELMGVVEKASDIAKAGIEELQSQNADLAVQLANTESKCRELAAKNSTIKVMNDCLSEELRGYESDGAFEGPKMHLLWWKVKTPATDAFLTEVRAQGVEGFLKFCGEENSVFVETKAYYRSLADAVEEFAAQLRQGAAHE